MADWFPISDSAVDPDAPITSELGYAFRDNPIAIAEGALGAPRVLPKALKSPGIVSGAISGTTWVAFVGLGDIKQIRFDLAWASAGASAAIQVAFSNDGGTTWGASQTLVNALTSGLGACAFGHIDIETGAFACAAINVGASTTGNGSLAATLTVPANCNAVRFNSNSGNPAGRVFITPIGGRE